MRDVKSACRYCCGACGVVATLNDQDRIVSLRGDRDHALTAGFACIRGLQSIEAMYSPDRILHPLKRLPDGSFQQIALETALDEIAWKLGTILDQSGGESMAIFKGTQTWKNVTAHAMLNAWPAAMGSTRVFTTITIDQSAKQVTMRRMGYWDAGKQRLNDSDVLMIVGGNPFVSVATANLTYDPVKRLKAAIRRGMKLIVIDPRFTETARNAHCFLQPKPGEDPTLLAGLLRAIIAQNWHDAAFCDRHVAGFNELRAAVESFTLDYVAQRTGVTAAQITQVARMFAHQSRRGIASAGTGPSMSPRSNLSDHLVECLNAICGRYYRAGEEILNPGVQNKRRAYRAEVVPPNREWETGPHTGSGHGSLFGELMSGVLAEEILREDQGRIRAMFVNGGNPAVALPDQNKAVAALKALDLLVAIEPFMTPTAKLCHYILPPKLQFERVDTTATPHYEPMIDVPFAQYVPAIVTVPPGSDIVDDWYPYWAIAKRLGRSISIAGTPLDMVNPPTTDGLLDIILRDSQVPLNDIRKYPAGQVFAVERAFVEPQRPDKSTRFDIMPADVRAELQEVFEEGATSVDPSVIKFTHRLSVRRLRATMNSLGILQTEIRRRHPFNAAYLHSSDLAALDLADGACVDIVSDHGSIPAIVESDDTMRPGVVSMSHCWGSLPDENLAYTDMGSSTNLLVRTDRFVETINAMPRMSSIPVRIRRRVAA